MDPFHFVDKIVYINLDHREDRRKHIVAELTKVGVPESKIQRFSAIKHQRGAIGCTSSHIAVLKLAIQEGWNSLIIMEDDAQWSNFEAGYKALEAIEASHDVVILGGTSHRYNQNKLVHCQTTTGYLVHKAYYERLLANFEEGLKKFLETNNPPQFAIDMYWAKLMAIDNWALIRPSLIRQIPGHSDIEGYSVNYLSYFA